MNWHRFVRELRKPDVEGVNDFDILQRAAVDLLQTGQYVEVRTCKWQRFFFRPHRQLIALLRDPVRSHIKTAQQLQDYLVANPNVLDGVDLQLHERGGI